ncbi:hypothetical protein Cs7R123_62920 [Catellatospora sp. TT07R-123]|uniref:hypothetical protein n=1 Tax=Catellatospora sp. TT07R-123 TaxID=2733863 RepID=UPI001B2D4605|nr:hypothetical protein [Catellatospora sp. TT07R-123]GHJ48950.1 hypothetical protein Cs7R123_62920 [Catellatospora sp. TT07R-123]
MTEPIQPDDPQTPWARAQSAPVDRATTRARRYAEGLPDWEPLPPGEIVVQRRRD